MTFGINGIIDIIEHNEERMHAKVLMHWSGASLHLYVD